MSPPSEARPRTGDLCQMVESIAFFEGYRPVLEGLKMMCYGKFPLKVKRFEYSPYYWDFNEVISRPICTPQSSSLSVKRFTNFNNVLSYFHFITVLCVVPLPLGQSLCLVCDNFLTIFCWRPFKLANQNGRTVGGGVDVSAMLVYQLMATPPLTVLAFWFAISKLSKRCQKAVIN